MVEALKVYRHDCEQTLVYHSYEKSYVKTNQYFCTIKNNMFWF